MDGEAVMAAFATCSGPDSIKDIFKTYGSRLKVYTALKAAIGESYQQSVSMCQNVLLISIVNVLYFGIFILTGVYTPIFPVLSISKHPIFICIQSAGNSVCYAYPFLQID